MANEDIVNREWSTKTSLTDVDPVVLNSSKIRLSFMFLQIQHTREGFGNTILTNISTAFIPQRAFDGLSLLLKQVL